MEERIKENINNPEKLEQLYRDDRKSFESSFEKVYSEIEKSELAKYWKIRLDSNKTPDKIKTSNLLDIFVLILVCLMAGFLIKIPDIFNLKITDIFFYEKNAGIIVFFGLTLYVVLTDRIFEPKRLVPILIAFIILTIYTNLLRSVKDSASINLVYIHLPLLMWCIFGLVFIDFNSLVMR